MIYYYAFTVHTKNITMRSHLYVNTTACALNKNWISKATTVLTTILDDFYELLDDGRIVCLINLDYSNAFDCMDIIRPNKF